MIAIVHGTTWIRQGQGPGPVDSGLAAWTSSGAEAFEGLGAGRLPGRGRLMGGWGGAAARLDGGQVWF